MESVSTKFWSEIESRPWNGDSEEAKNKHKQWFPHCAGSSPFIDELLDEENPHNLIGKKFVDLGCGNGFMSFRLAAIHGCSVRAFDLPFMEPYFRLSFFSGWQISDLSSVNVEFISGDLTTHKQFAPDNSIDCVIANNVLSYINPTKLKETLEKVVRCLSINGIFLFSLFTKPALTAIDLMRANESGTMIYKAPDHSDFIHKMCQSVGLSVMSIAVYDPPNDHAKYVQAIKFDRVISSPTDREPIPSLDSDDQSPAANTPLSTDSSHEEVGSQDEIVAAPLRRSVRIAIKNEQK